MNTNEVDKIRKMLKELVGPSGAYVLMLNDGRDTQMWTDGESRLKMRGLLETGYDMIRDGLAVNPDQCHDPRESN